MNETISQSCLEELAADLRGEKPGLFDFYDGTNQAGRDDEQIDAAHARVSRFAPPDEERKLLTAATGLVTDKFGAAIQVLLDIVCHCDMKRMAQSYPLTWNSGDTTLNFSISSITVVILLSFKIN